MNSSILVGDAISCICPVSESRLLVDARDYYLAFVQSAKQAQSTLFLAGWQFDTQVELVRGEDKKAHPEPTQFVTFLNYLCEQNADLQIYVLAWDYSSIYAVEREWLQRLKLNFTTHERVHFEYLTHVEAGGSFHRKYAVIDDQIAFVGGLDICDNRYDNQNHQLVNPERVDVKGRPSKPFHDLQLALLGEVASRVGDQFVRDWQQASDRDIERASTSRPAPSTFHFSVGLPIRASELALSRTLFNPSGEAPKEIRILFERAIKSAEQLIYVENQYFTSQAILAALKERLEDPGRNKLVLIFVMPEGADTPKEDFVLGDRQRAVRDAVAKLAQVNGHEFRLLKSATKDKNGESVATFIHAKLMIVDDELLICGSANWTNRSMHVDMELNVSFQIDQGSEQAASLSADIREIRATLLQEHAGYADPAPFRDLDQLVRAIDEACDSDQSKLCCQELKAVENEDPFLVAVFDPKGPTTVESLDAALEQSFTAHDTLIKKTMRRFGQRLGVFDIDTE